MWQSRHGTTSSWPDSDSAAPIAELQLQALRAGPHCLCECGNEQKPIAKPRDAPAAAAESAAEALRQTSRINGEHLSVPSCCPAHEGDDLRVDVIEIWPGLHVHVRTTCQPLGL